MALYMLDTDTARYLIRGRVPALDRRIAHMAPRRLCISAVTRGELLYGLQIKDGAHKLAKLIDEFLRRIQCLPWDEVAATHFATVAAALHKAGTRIGNMDAMIAGHAMAAEAVLVTNNDRHFARVTDLAVENWSR